MQDKDLEKQENSQNFLQKAVGAPKNSNIKKYRITGKMLRQVFGAYKEVFAENNLKEFEKFNRSTKDGMRILLIKEESETNPIFAMVMQTAKYSKTIFLSKMHEENHENSLKFFKKIKNFFNPDDVFSNLIIHEKEKG